MRAARHRQDGINAAFVLHQAFRCKGISVVNQPMAQVSSLRHGLQQQHMAVSRPWRCGQDGDNRLASHAGDDDDIRLFRRDSGQARAQTKVDALYTVLLRRAAGVLQRLRTDVGGDGGEYPPLLQQRHRQVAVIRAYVRQATTVRYQLRQTAQAWL